MRQNPPHDQTPAPRGVKHAFLQNEEGDGPAAAFVPFFVVEARLDFNDVRPGFRTTVGLSKALEIHSVGSDSLWAEDMVLDVDPQKVSSVAPASLQRAPLPDFVDPGFMAQMESHFIRYLLNTFKARVYRNYLLNLYSNAGESLEDFTARCLALLATEWRRDLDDLQEVYNRRLGQLGQKYLKADSSESFELAKLGSQGRDYFSEYLERIAELFQRAKPEAGLRGRKGFQIPLSFSELGERLAGLEAEAQRAIEGLWNSYREKAQSTDEYIVHPNLKDIHIVRYCILWMPSKAA